MTSARRGRWRRRSSASSPPPPRARAPLPPWPASRARRSTPTSRSLTRACPRSCLSMTSGSGNTVATSPSTTTTDRRSCRRR
uniref:Uncharacterized protein n=1 Tax=Arundo donax TaxID=35708 RepID=A0A0A9E6W7_ARUDO